MHSNQVLPNANTNSTEQKPEEPQHFQNYSMPQVTESNFHHLGYMNQKGQNVAVNYVNSRDPRLLKKSSSFNNCPVNLPFNYIAPSNNLPQINPSPPNFQNYQYQFPGKSQQNCPENSFSSNSPYFLQTSQKYYQEIYQNYSTGWVFPNYSYQNTPESFSTNPDKGPSSQQNQKSPCYTSSASQDRSNIPITSPVQSKSSTNFHSEGNWNTLNDDQNKIPPVAPYDVERPGNAECFNYTPNSETVGSDKNIENEDKVGALNVNQNKVSEKNNTGDDVITQPLGIHNNVSLTSHSGKKTDSLYKKNKNHDNSRPICTSFSSRRNRRSRSGSHNDKYNSRSRSRSHSSGRQSKDRSRSRSGSNTRSRYRSRSRSDSRCRSRSYTRCRSRSGSNSRCRSRSRSNSRFRSRFKSRSRSNSRFRSRYRSRSRSNSRFRSRYRSRSRSGSKPRSRYRSRSRSGSKPRSRYRRRSRSRSNPRLRNGSTSRSQSISTFRSRSRSKSKLNTRHHYDSIFPKSQMYGRRERALDTKQNTRNNPEKSEYLRRRLIEKWRMNNCDTQDEMQKRLQELSEMNPDEILEEENKVWIRSAPADCYYERDPGDLKRMRATGRLQKLCVKFRCELLERGQRARQAQNLKCPSPRKPKQKLCKHRSQICSSSSESGSESDESDDMNDIIEELQRKQKHPYRLHPELWYNDPGEMNDGPLCRCSAKARRSGIRHGFYAGENQRAYCDPKSNNAGNLYHYRITISPPTNFLTRTPTIINHDDHEFIFEGFSLISHYPIEKLPTCKVIRFNIEYIILYVEEKLPENFCIEEVDLFYNYLFKEILELVDFDMTNLQFPDSCPQFHFMPRFVRELPENGRELLPMCEVLKYLLDHNKKLIEDDALENIHKMSSTCWQRFADSVKGMVVTNPGMKPCSLRVDQLDRETDEYRKRNFKNADQKIEGFKKSSSSERSSHEKDLKQPSTENTDANLEGKEDTKNDLISSNKFYPEIVHFGIRPPQLSYAGNPEYQKAWRKYVKFRHLLANMPKPTPEDKQKLAAKENCLHTMRAHNKMKRDVTVTVSSEGFYLTGLMCDIVQHAMLIPVLVCHLRFHRSLAVLEERIGYKFQNRFLLQLALTHPSYRENFGTNPDHARNSLTNCGIRQPKYGDRRIHFMNTRKRGINTLINIMSRFGKKNETQSNIYHNERLEFLGDAVVEFITSIHLFHIFRDLEEGGLATYRAALVQNQHLAVLAKKLNLNEYMLYAHGSDLCHDLELRHAMANCFEALMGALFLDGGIEAADQVFGHTLYGDDVDCLDIWCNYPPHPLQEQEPLGDRKWILQIPLLQKLTEFEEETGIEFKHIRLLARAFTDRSVGYTNLTMGSNQRLEFLGDSVLQLIASEYLYKYFPEHHEGHLSLLRSSLVNNKTQSVVCDDLGMIKYAVYANPKVELKVKDRADLLEAFLGALYVDSGLEVCRVFCDVCFFPRLQVFIMNQDWNDPKSKLQQCCLTLRTMDNVEPDIPVYKVVECKGPTNTRVYTVAVYFRNKRLAEATGHSIQQAEMNAAQKAMEVSGPLFPQLDHQKRVIAKSLKTQKWPNRNSWSLDWTNYSPRDSDRGEAPFWEGPRT